MNSISICIADYIIRLNSDDDYELQLEDSYIPFVASQNESPDIEVNVYKAIPSELNNENNVVFSSKDNNKKYFTICEYQDALKIIVYQQNDDNGIQQIAILNSAFDEWKIYLDDTEPCNKIYPLAYPMGPLIFYYLTVKFKAIMLHASAVKFEGRAYLFTGFSGVGKSTMAYLWQQKGGLIINDDRLIIRKKDDGYYYIYNTPMFYVDNSKKTKLNVICFIKHDIQNTISDVNGVHAVSKLMAYCIQHGFNQSFLEHHLDFLSELCLNVPTYDLGFIPDVSIVDFLKKYAGRKII